MNKIILFFWFILHLFFVITDMKSLYLNNFSTISVGILSAFFLLCHHREMYIIFQRSLASDWTCDLRDFVTWLNMGGTCLVQFRARIGQFYGNAIKSSTFRLSFIDLNNIYPFLILVYSGTNGLPLALWLSILHSPENTHKNGINPPNCTSSCSYCMPYVPDSNYLTLLLCTLL